MAHANFEFGESDGRCDHCDSRTVLVSFYGNASVDQEPFESGEYSEDSPESKQGIEIPDDVYVDDEISGHYCIKCDALTTLCINPPRRRRFSELDPDIESKLFIQRMKERGIEVEIKLLEPNESN